jgi:drug/metabolite transporter (DMT)-like permease
MVPAVFQVTFAMLITGAIALLFEHPWDARPALGGVVAILWLGLLGSGLAYLAFFRLLSRWGATRTSLVAYVLPIVGIALGFLVLREPIDGRMLAGTALIIGGVALVNSRFGRQLVFERTRPSLAHAEASPPRG